jgi:hypothetical protein
MIVETSIIINPVYNNSKKCLLNKNDLSVLTPCTPLPCMSIKINKKISLLDGDEKNYHTRLFSGIGVT